MGASIACGFSVTFETVTQESAEHGEAEEIGFIGESLSLREAIDALGCPEQGFEGSSYPALHSRWITAYKVNECFESGSVENRSLHFPGNLSQSSKARILRLFGIVQ